MEEDVNLESIEFSVKYTILFRLEVLIIKKKNLSSR